MPTYTCRFCERPDVKNNPDFPFGPRTCRLETSNPIDPQRLFLTLDRIIMNIECPFYAGKRGLFPEWRLDLGPNSRIQP